MPSEAVLYGQLALTGGGGKAGNISYSVLDLWLGQLHLGQTLLLSQFRRLLMEQTMIYSMTEK